MTRAVKKLTFSLLPQRQRNGCDLACQRQARHGGLYAFRQQSFVEVLERAGAHTGHGGRSFETLQIMVVVLVQAPDGDEFFRASQLTFYIAVFPADPGLQGQSTVGPQLALAAETMRGLD